MNMKPEQIFSGMAALSDPMRGRVLLVLERRELTVTELCAVFQLPQSSMSRHLKTLVDEGWLVWRAEGTSRQYRLSPRAGGGALGRLWELVREQVSLLPAADEDARRVRSVLALRSAKGREFFSTTGGEWDRLRSELFGRRFELLGLLGLLDAGWTVGDLGCGTGQVSEALAPFVAGVVAVDESPEMLAAARRRLEGFENVELRGGELESLPLASASLDAAVMFLVLPYLAEPAAVLAEVARVLRPGGRALVVDMMPHNREEYRQRMGHLSLGVPAETIQGWMTSAGLEEFRHVALPPEADAKGPGLFAVSGRK